MAKFQSFDVWCDSLKAALAQTDDFEAIIAIKAKADAEFATWAKGVVAARAAANVAAAIKEHEAAIAALKGSN